MNSNKGKDKFLVVYQITNMINGKIYIGAHITYNKNDRYMGSSKSLKEDIKKLGRENFKKEILCECSTKEDMMKKEAEYVTREFCHRPDTYNRHIGGSDNFTMEGMLSVINPEGGYMKIYDDDPRWLSGELKSMMKGTVMVQDKEGNRIRVSKDDPRYLSGEFVGICKGKANVKDKEGNHFQINKDDPRYLSGELIPIQNGQIQHFNASRLGKKHSEETKKKIKQKRKEQIISEETKEKIRNKLKNRKFSDETINKMRQSRLNYLNINKLSNL